MRKTIRLNGELAKELERIAVKKDLDLSKVFRRALRFWIGSGCPEEAISEPAAER